MEHCRRIQYPLDLYGTMKPGECSSVDWPESEMHGFTKGMAYVCVFHDFIYRMVQNFDGGKY